VLAVGLELVLGRLAVVEVIEPMANREINQNKQKREREETVCVCVRAGERERERERERDREREREICGLKIFIRLRKMGSNIRIGMLLLRGRDIVVLCDGL
jgi:hypothetical protein